MIFHLKRIHPAIALTMAMTLTLAVLATPTTGADSSLGNVVVLFTKAPPADFQQQVGSDGTVVRTDATLHYALVATPNANGFLNAMSNRADVAAAYPQNNGEVSAVHYCVLGALSQPCPGGLTNPTTPAPTSYPNDPAYNAQCGTLHCQWGPWAVNASGAWGQTLGSHSVIVAILDTGVDPTHPDITSNLKAVGGTYGINEITPGTAPADGYGHGTAVAGILAGVTNNGIGMSGMAQAYLLAVKVCDDSGSCPDTAVASGITDAVAAGASIISISLQFNIASDPVIDQALQVAANNGALIVAPSGDGGANFVAYPASSPLVMAVSGVTSTGNLSSFSNYGSKVDVAAPAGECSSDWKDIYTTVPQSFGGGGYGLWCGTSFAVPFVSGIACLLKTLHPLWTYGTIRTTIIDTAKASGPTPSPYTGYGVVDAGAAAHF